MILPSSNKKVIERGRGNGNGNEPISDAAGLHVTDDVTLARAIWRPLQRDQDAQLARGVFAEAQEAELLVDRRRQRR